MNPASALFGTAVGIRNRLYDRGKLVQHRLRGPVVSIGNISVGGTGKTPFTLLLGDLLLARGVPFDILSRGYRRESQETAIVDPKGSAREFGDEPLLMARHFRETAQVVVGADRYQAGLLAERQFGPRLHLLDDGFQHRRLARDFDIVLLSPDDAVQSLLPFGRLREPLASLARADAVVLGSEARLSEFPLNLPVTDQQVWRLERDIEPPDLVPGARPLAFCGIARPERFFEDLRRHGIAPAAQARFRDHHAYNRGDVEKLKTLARTRKADCFLTTEKDIANLSALRGLLEKVAPVVPVRVRLALQDPDAALDAIVRKIRKGAQQ